jgi:molybdenum cofactor cytidylyltransferase
MSVAGDTEGGLYTIVLAAGAAARFGSPKQLVRISGRPLLHNTVSNAVQITGAATIVVLGAYAAELAPLLGHTPASVLINREWHEGIGSSIRRGVAALPAACSAVMIVLADQAAVTAQDLQRLVSAWKRQPEYVAAALYCGSTGVPAIFPRSRFAELGELRGDVGARRLLQRSPDRIVRVLMDSAALDIDTPEDLLSLSAGQQNN